MDLMKSSNEEQTIGNNPATDGTVTAVNSNGKPIAGRYPFRRYTLNDKKPVTPAVETVSEEPVKAEEPKEPELTPIEEAKAEDITISKCVKWMHEHPKYTKDELREVKVGFAKEAQQEVINARAKHDN